MSVFGNDSIVFFVVKCKSNIGFRFAAVFYADKFAFGQCFNKHIFFRNSTSKVVAQGKNIGSRTVECVIQNACGYTVKQHAVSADFKEYKRVKTLFKCDCQIESRIIGVIFYRDCRRIADDKDSKGISIAKSVIDG